MENTMPPASTPTLPLHKVPAVRALLAIRYALSGALASTAVLLVALLPLLLLTALVMERYGVLSHAVLCLVAAVASLLVGLGLGWLCTARAPRAEPSNQLLLGALVWAAGALALGFDGILLQFCVGILLVGLGLCLCCCGAHRLTPVLHNVVRFLGYDEDAWNELRQRRRWLSLDWAGGAMLLCGLLLLVFRPRFRLVLSLATLLCVALVALWALQCPIDRRYAHKLDRLLSQEEECKPLRHQLENVVLHTHRRPWFILALIAVLQRVYPHHLQGAEHIHKDEENPLIYLCNHGNLYGPMVCMLFIPSYVRPWSISQVMVDKEETVQYLYRYNFSEAKWLPRPLRMPVSRLVAALSHWCMHSLEAIPVYRDHPRQLITTFRTAVDALQCGDAMLIFPENPNAVEQDHGYERSGVGTLFSGFAMLAPAYYHRTGKRCRFLPLYAHQGRHVLRFGEEVVYDPDNDPMAERDRLVQAIADQMNRLCAEVEEQVAQRRG